MEVFDEIVKLLNEKDVELEEEVLEELESNDIETPSEVNENFFQQFSEIFNNKKEIQISNQKKSKIINKKIKSLENKILEDFAYLCISKHCVENATKLPSLISLDGFWKSFSRTGVDENLTDGEDSVKQLLFRKKDKLKKLKFSIYIFASVSDNGTFVPVGFSFSNKINGTILQNV